MAITGRSVALGCLVLPDVVVLAVLGTAVKQQT